jgi:DNA-binding GntR family transcriptional regulator
MAYEATAETEGVTKVGIVAAGLDHRTLWQRVYDYLRDEILADRLKPGTVLQEVALAQSLGVSRGPVREALGRLAAEGLVTIRPRRGAVVRALSKEEFVEAYQLREALEMMAARLAVPRLTADDVAVLQRLIEEMSAHADRGDVHGFFDANTAFHETFFDVAGNRMLKDAYNQLRSQIDRYRLRSLQLRGELRRSIAEHKAILRAAKAGDVEKTVHLVSEHIRVPQIRLLVEEHEEEQAAGGERS